MRKVGLFLIATLLLAACSPASEDGDADGANGEGGGAAANPVQLPMNEFMAHVVQYSAANVWKWQGVVSDAAGERDLSPKTDQDWKDAENASLTLAEVTNMLMAADRRVDDPRWDAAVAQVREVAFKEAAAAEKKDNGAYFAAGRELSVACESCHVHFAPGYTAPPDLKLAPPPLNQQEPAG